ncbi:MAG: HD domain-containing protein, partial [Candidatus Paceibacterota bacterium]
ARVSDLNYVHQKYVERKEAKAVDDLTHTLPFGKDILETIHEYEERKTPESILAKDADNLEWIISLKEQVDIGNTRAKDWINSALQRLKTKVAEDVAAEIMKSESTDWWFGDKNSSWWVNRNK